MAMTTRSVFLAMALALAPLAGGSVLREALLDGASASRMVGYPGYARTLAAFRAVLDELGYTQVFEADFDMAVPVETAASVEVGDRRFAVHSFLPNLVASGPNTFGGRLLYAGDGRLANVDGRSLRDRIVVLDLGSADAWQRLASLGAAAFIFLQPAADASSHADYRTKILEAPVEVPRVLLPRGDVEEFLVLARAGASATLSRELSWRSTAARNLTVLIPAATALRLPGSDQAPGPEAVVAVHAALDAVSLVPGLAPGGDNAFNLLIIERLLREWALRPPPVSVLLTVFSGNAMALSGARDFAMRFLSEAGAPTVARERELLDDMAALEALRALIDEAALTEPVGFLRGLALGHQGIAHPVIANLYGLVTIELAEISEQLLGIIAQGAEARDAATTAAVERLLARRDELNFLSNLRYRRFRPQGEIAAKRHPLVQLFRAASADTEEAPELVAGAPETLRSLLRELHTRLGFKIDEDRIALGRLREARELKNALAERQIVFTLGLDLSAAARGIVLAGGGDMYRLNHFDTLNRQLGEFLRPFSDAFNARHGGAAAATAIVPPLLNVLSGEHGDTWQKHVNYPLATAAEAFALLRIPGLTLAGNDDFRGVVDTPEDDLARLDAALVHERSALAADCLAGLLGEVQRMLADPSVDRRLKVLPVDFKPQTGFWGRVYGLATRPSARNVEPMLRGVGGVLAVREGKLEKGLRTYDVRLTNTVGRFEFPLVPTNRCPMGNPRETQLHAFRIDADSGLIGQAMDLGETGKVYPTVFTLTGDERGTALVMFDCRSISVLDGVDPRSFAALPAPRIFSGRSDDQLRLYGTYASGAAVVCFVPASEPVRLLYSGPDFHARMMLLNSSAEQVLGRGFEPGGERVLSMPQLHAARDMWWRTRELRDTLERAGIRSGFIDYLQERAERAFTLAEEALAEHDYSGHVRHAYLAWSLTSRAYPKVLQLANSTVHGLVFYLFLIIPFAVIIERLFFSHARVLFRGLTTGAIGVVFYNVISALHPAVRIIQNPLVLFISFGLIALTGYVIALLWARFEGTMARWKMKDTGVTRESLARGAAFGLALSVGIGNLRRAPARTALTVLSLTLFTIVVVSLISVRASLSVNEVALRFRPDLDGLMVRDPKHEGLSTTLAATLDVFYGADCEIHETRITGNAIRWTPDWSTTGGISGLPPAVQRRILSAGAILDPDGWTCLLPDIQDAARGLDTRALIGSTRPIAGRAVTVTGVFDPALFNRLIGLDGEAMTPIDLVEMEKLRDVYRRMGQDEIDVVPPRLSAEDAAIFSAPVMDLVPGIRDSLILTAPDSGRLRAIARDLVLRTDFYCFHAENGAGTVFSISDRGEVKGLADIGIPVLICGLIILNTMLGAVASQMRHIPTFSAVGLAPKHIASLFFVEALVYSVIAAMAGYIIGQMTAKLIAASGLIPGMVLDYSSAASLLGCGIVIGVTLLSTAYPAYQAMTVATPKSDLEDKPGFEGDRMRALLPFALTGRQAVGGIGFLYAFILGHDEMLGADSFFAQNTRIRQRAAGNGRVDVMIDFDMWLAPIDLGNYQRVRIWSATDAHDVMNIHVEARRVTGDLHSWKTCNLGFLATLRKQMLLWRMVEETERPRYVARVREAPFETVPPEAIDSIAEGQVRA